MDKIRIVSLGGLDEMYKQCVVVEINDDIFVVECGLKMPDITKPGIDYVIPRHDYLLENKDRIKGYFLTHGHDSVIGGIPYIINKAPAPIYCSSITKVFLESFCVHNHLDSSSFVYKIVEPSDEIMINNHKISLFSTCTNIAKSFGIAFDTDQGNIVFLSNCVFDNNRDNGFILDLRRVAQIASTKQTLLLMQDSSFAERLGYTSPNYRIVPLTQKILRDSQGRIIMALEAADVYNIIATINEAIKCNRKIVLYDQSTRDIVNCLVESNCLSIPKNFIVPMGEVNRVRAQELIIIMTGFESNLYRKIALLASHRNDEQVLQLNATDSVIIATHADKDSEIVRTDAINELYHNDCKIYSFGSPQFIKMHASQEDIKTALSIFRPRYYLPIQGRFVQLLANAKVALNMNIGLNHNNVFIMDNGDALQIENYLAKIVPGVAVTGNIFVDGKGLGDVASNVLEERQKLSDDGVILLAATISKSQREIILGPDIQTRGLVFVKESDSLMKDIERTFNLCVNQELAKPSYSKSYLEATIKETVFKAVRRHILKAPIVIPIILEIE